MQFLQSITHSANFIDQAFRHCLFSFQQGSYVFHQLCRIQHQLFDPLLFHVGMLCQKPCDAILGTDHIFQALTQIQEMTLAFVPKIIGVFVTIILLFPFMLNQMKTLTEGLFDKIVSGG